jgi:predicted amidophosphoribosyltransferase
LCAGAVEATRSHGHPCAPPLFHACKTMFLIDDALARASMTEACAQTLKRPGAARVELVSWARLVKSPQLMR